MATTSGVIKELIDTHVVDISDVALVTGASSRAVSRWNASRANPRGQAQDRLLDLKLVVDQVRSVLREEPARRWLRSPNPELDWRKPLELIAEGDRYRVEAAILAIAEGVTR